MYVKMLPALLFLIARCLQSSIIANYINVNKTGASNISKAPFALLEKRIPGGVLQTFYVSEQLFYQAASAMGNLISSMR